MDTATPPSATSSTPHTQAARFSPSLLLLIVLLTAATAYLLYQNRVLRHQIAQTQVPPPAPTPTLLPDRKTNRSDLKPYTDTRHGYTISYPATWTLTSARDSTIITPPKNTDCLPPKQCGGIGDNYAQISITPNIQALPLDRFALEYLFRKFDANSFNKLDTFDLLPSDHTDELVNRVVRSGIPKNEIIGKHIKGACGEEYLFLKRPDSVLVINFFCLSSDDEHDMLSTFRLTN